VSTDRYCDLLLVRPLRLDHKLARSAHLLHRLNAVDDEVHDDLLQLNAIPMIGGISSASMVWIETEFRVISLCKRAIISRITSLISTSVRSGVPFVNIRPDPTDDFGGASCVGDDSRRRFTCFLNVGAITVEPAQAGGGVGNGGSDRLIQFVCQRSRQFPHGGHPADAREIRMSPTEHLALLIGSDALGNVRYRSDVLKIT